MNIFQAILLGIVQGITEFLPISSSAHLVIIPFLLGWRLPSDQIFPFDVLIQLGTLVALIIYFFKDLRVLFQTLIKSIHSRTFWRSNDAALAWYILITTIPAGLAGLLLKSKVESAFNYPAVSALFLIGTAFLLFLAEIVGKQKYSLSQLTLWKSLLIGLFQAGSIFPGISRSGACITGAMLQQFQRKDAGRFSFLLGIPIMLAAGLLGVVDLLKVKHLPTFLPILLIGFLTAAVVGYLVIHWLLTYLAKHSLFPFVIYCVLFGLFTLGMGIHNPTLLNSSSTMMEGQIINISIDPSLTWINAHLSECNQETSKYAIRFREELTNTFSTDYLRMTINENEIKDQTAYLLGEEELILAAGNDIPVNKISLESIKDIFSGLVNNLEGLRVVCPQCEFTSEPATWSTQPFQIWMYPRESNPQQMIEKNVLRSIHVSESANLVPNPQAMVEALRLSSTGIGILPEHWWNSSIKRIDLVEPASSDWEIPILAIPSDVSFTGIKELLACVHTRIQNNE